VKDSRYVLGQENEQTVSKLCNPPCFFVKQAFVKPGGFGMIRRSLFDLMWA
jgi:hypothetical protein